MYIRRNDGKPFGLIFAVGYLAYTSIYIARLNFSVASTLFEASGSIDKVQIGIIGSVFAFTYAIFKLPNGYIGDRVSPKKLFLVGLFLAGISNILIGFCSGFISIAIFWGLNAFGQSMLWGPLLRICSAYAPEHEFSKYSQILVSSVAAGGMLGLVVATYLGTRLGVESCFIIPGCLAILCAILVYTVFPNEHEKHDIARKGVAESIGILLRNKRFRNVMFPSVAHGMIRDNVNVWLALYCVDSFGMNIESLKWYIFFVPAAALIGRFLYPALSSIIKNDYAISISSFAFCVVAVLLLVSGTDSVFVGMGCLGVIAALMSMINTHFLSTFPAEFVETDNVSLVVGILDLLTYAGSGIGSLCFGVLISRYGYSGMFTVWGIISIISAILLSFQIKKVKE